jgi:ribonuclease D
VFSLCFLNAYQVLHGADRDVTWLQRDFRIYIVNLFDTGQAARVLEFPSFGLAYLMNHYCGVKLDKRFQLADWRLRPLSDEMLNYARMDTHNLLYVRDRLRVGLPLSFRLPARFSELSHDRRGRDPGRNGFHELRYTHVCAGSG